MWILEKTHPQEFRFFRVPSRVQAVLDLGAAKFILIEVRSHF
ncbi:hypothetical protein [Chlorogloeopsis sp. ULAP02]